MNERRLGELGGGVGERRKIREDCNGLSQRENEL